MDRRTFLGTLGGSLFAAPFAAQAQHQERIPRVGVIGEHTSADPFVAAFSAGAARARLLLEGRSRADAKGDDGRS